MGRVSKGDVFASIPAGDWNSFHDAADGFREKHFAQNGPGRAANNSAAVEVGVLNAAEEDLTAEFPIVKLDAPSFANNRQRRRITLDGIAPVAGEDFAIVQGPLKDGKISSAVVSGVTWCKVDVVDEGDTTAGAIDDDFDKLQSGTGEIATILWKESGTGVKWALVRLGGGGVNADAVGASLAVVKGTVPASSAIDVTGTLSASSAVVTIGTLAVTKTDTTFTAGACMVGADGKPIFVDGVLQAHAVINPSYTDFIGEGPGVLVAGNLITLGEDTYFVIPRFELRSEPGFVLGSDAEDDAQALYHAGAARDQKLGREDCD